MEEAPRRVMETVMQQLMAEQARLDARLKTLGEQLSQGTKEHRAEWATGEPKGGEEGRQLPSAWAHLLALRRRPRKKRQRSHGPRRAVRRAVPAVLLVVVARRRRSSSVVARRRLSSSVVVCRRLSSSAVDRLVHPRPFRSLRPSSFSAL